MLDVMGGITIAGVAVLLVAALARFAHLEAAQRRTLFVIAGVWFAAFAILGAAGLFMRPPGISTMLLGLGVLLPVLAGLVFLARSSTGRAIASRTPLAALVGLHVTRSLGVAFLALLAAGRLPRTFALTAGWGDIVVAATAIPVAWAVHRRTPGWRWVTAIWNTYAIADLVTAVTLGQGSTPGSPTRFIFESPGSGAITTLPWVMVPVFLVPFYFLIHLVIFRRLAVAAHDEAARRAAPPAAGRQVAAL